MPPLEGVGHELAAAIERHPPGVYDSDAFFEADMRRIEQQERPSIQQREHSGSRFIPE